MKIIRWLIYKYGDEWYWSSGFDLRGSNRENFRSFNGYWLPSKNDVWFNVSYNNLICSASLFQSKNISSFPKTKQKFTSNFFDSNNICIIIKPKKRWVIHRQFPWLIQWMPDCFNYPENKWENTILHQKDSLSFSLFFFLLQTTTKKKITDYLSRRSN